MVEGEGEGEGEKIGGKITDEGSVSERRTNP